MKAFRVIFVTFLLLLCIAGCSSNDSAPGSTAGNAVTDATHSETAEATVAPTEAASVFDEKEPLFICQDRFDIEDDRGTYYFYNYKGDLLDSKAYAQIGFYGKNGLAPAADPITGKIGFVDNSGVFVIAPQWDDAAAFSDDGIALVISEDKETYEDKYSFINDKGEPLTPCVYDYATSFYPKGLAIIGFQEEAVYTYTDEEGKEQTETYQQTRKGVIDTHGNTILEPKFNHIEDIAEDYIICRLEDEYTIYDLSGKLIYECETYIDEKSSYSYEIENAKLYRSIRTKRDPEDIPDSAFNEYVYSDRMVFNGKEFDHEPAIYNDAIILYEHVATTASGKGYGVVYGKTRKERRCVIPYEYDRIIRYGSYYVCIKAAIDNPYKETLDIYNASFEKTAENIPYSYYPSRTEPFGEDIMLPDGYIPVYIFDEQARETLTGIIDYTGKVIVPLLYYRPIRLFTYEGSGGKFE